MMDLQKILFDPEARSKLSPLQLQDLLRRLQAIQTSPKTIPWETPGEMAEALTANLPPAQRWRMAPHLEALDHHLLAAAERQNPRLLITMPPRHGKQLADSTPVLTTNGWKSHGDLKPGDFVFDLDGKPTKVLAVSEPSNEKLLVSFSDGTSISAHPNHEWVVFNRSSGQWEIRETRELKPNWVGRCQFQLPPAPPIQFPEASLPVDPYFLGLWLGDGTTGKPLICGTEADMKHYATRISYPVGYHWIHPSTGVHYQYYKETSSLLREAGVLHHKHIPRSYLQSSETQRRALLAGLVDTDGSVNKDGRVRFVTASPDLASDVQELVRSLGYRCNLQTRTPQFRNRPIKDLQPIYVVDWTPLDGQGQGTLPRKVHPRFGVSRRIGIRSVSPAPDEPGRCIQVNHPSGVYLAGVGLTPTHNSQLTSIYFPFWLLVRDPSTKIIFATYSEDFARFFGNAVRDLVVLHGEKYGLQLSKETNSATDWKLLSGGGMVSTGAGGSLTGRGANALIIDDPIKNSEEAFSETSRENLWNWFETTAFTRLEPGGFCVVIHTRWHQDDLIGRLHTKSKAQEIPPWTLINFPALAESEDELGRNPGDPLWPERYSQAALEDIKKSISPYNWSALYQQRPTPEEGGAIKRSWWQYYDSLPSEFDEVIQSWDLAFKDLQTSDYCVGQIWGRKGARFYLIHQIRERLNLPAVASRIRSLREVYPEAHAVLIEDTANGPALIQVLHSSVAGLIPRKVKGSKDTRVSAVSPFIESGNVFLPRSSPWLGDFTEECAAFPNGTHDDQVDAMTQALIYLGPKATQSVNRDHREAIIPVGVKTPLELQAAKFHSWKEKRLKKSAKLINKPRRIL